MKKISLISLTALAVISISCNKEIAINQEDGFSPKILTATTDDNAVTKTSLDGTSVVWASGDAISAFDAEGQNHASTKTEVSASGKDAQFEIGSLSVEDDVMMALYPYDENATYDTDDYSVETTIPTVQNIVVNSFANGANVAIAEGLTDKLKFRNVGAFLCLSIANDNVKSVKLSSSTTMTGNVVIDYNEGEPELIFDDTKVVNDYVELKGDFVKGQKYYFVVAPGEYKDLTITLTDNEDKTASLSNSSTLNIKRNENLFIGALPAIPENNWKDEELDVSPSVDVLTVADFAATSTQYKEFSGVKKNYAVYVGKTSKNSSAFQIRTDGNDTGIVTTETGGYLQSVSISWNSGAANGRSIDVYGKNTPYTSAADLFDNEKKGTLIGSIAKGSSKVIVPEGVKYKYVGVRSHDASCPLDDITFEWDKTTPMESCATPWASVNSGAVERGTEIVLTTTTADAEIYYTLNGDEPTVSSTRYTDPIIINQACTLKSIAIAEGKRNSAVKTLSYTILKCATPVSDFASGALASGTEVSLSCSTDGASVYYTTDGSTPTSSSTLYSGKITVTEAMTLKAIAIKANYDDSDVDSWVFTISAGGTTEYTATWTASSGGFGTSGKAASSFTDSQNNTWAISIEDATYLGWTSPYIQVGSRNNPTNLTLSTSDITGIIKSITVSCYSYNGAHTYSFTIGGSEVATGSTSSAIEDIVYSTETAAGPITISFDKNSGRALYIKGITVVYEK